MSDLFPVFTDAAPAVAHVAKHVKTVHQHVQHAHSNLGFHMLTLLVSNSFTFIVAAGLGWYTKGRGWFGVKNDINNAKAEVEKAVTTVSA